jgi:putative endonuclease
MLQRTFYVYILTNQNKTVLYTGVTNHLEQRIMEHWSGSTSGTSFTAKYKAFYLLLYESHQYIDNAIRREKEIRLEKGKENGID